MTKDSTSTESSSQLFVDTAVYTRNRCFRFALSSKAGTNLCFFLQGDSNVRTWYGIFLLKNNFLMYILKLSNIILSLQYFFYKATQELFWCSFINNSAIYVILLLRKVWLLFMWVASSFRFQPCLWHDVIMHSYGILKENFFFDGLASLVLHKVQTRLWLVSKIRLHFYGLCLYWSQNYLCLFSLNY